MQTIGDIRRVKKFAFKPTRLSDDTKIWLYFYYEVFEWQQYKKWPIGKPDPRDLDYMAAITVDANFRSICIQAAKDVRDDIDRYHQRWTFVRTERVQ